MNKTTTATTVGLFLMIGFACTAYLTLTLSNTNVLKHNFYQLTAKFTTVSGLRVGSNIEISGVYVGRVSDITLDQKLYQAIITMEINNGINIPVDSTAAIKTSGLIGDKYVSIIPGGDSNNLQDNQSILDTQAPLDIEEMISKYVFGSVKK